MSEQEKEIAPIEEFMGTVGSDTLASGNTRKNRGLVDAEPVVKRPEGSDGMSKWSANEGNYWGVSKTYDSIPSGVYNCRMSDSGPFLSTHKISTDALVGLPDSAADKVISEIRKFMGLEAKFRKHGFLYKRGIMMWGPPGSGKTSALHQLSQLIMSDMNGITLIIDSPNIAAVCLKMIRQIEPSRMIVCILEDLDALVENHGEAQFLSLLDGESQVDNIVFVATTNYPERLDRRFVDRPSRFDTIQYVSMPELPARRKYLADKEPELANNPERLEEFAIKSKGYSIAHLRELIILTHCLGYELDAAIKRLSAMQKKLPNSQSTGGGAGFLSVSGDKD